MKQQNDKSAILLIYTGGTIGMKEDPSIQRDVVKGKPYYSKV